MPHRQGWCEAVLLHGNKAPADRQSRRARHAAGKMVEHLANTEINSQRIAAVESCFGASGQPLALPGRVLLGEGVLTKECRKKAKPRIFFLFNDILVYGSIVLSKRKYHSQHIIPLEEVTLEPLPETLQAKNRWMIRTAKKSFAVSAASATERQEWISHIEECVRRQLRATGRPPSTEHAAPWIPDKYRELAAEERAGAGAGPPAGAGSGASSGEDEDDSEEDKEGSGDGDWPSRVKFYGEGVSWSSFHS
ncbi:pleckstrin homology domain-containing family F member 1 [Pteropus alecto]|uniref:pleckstrin homology domain-containing family F member 1 n=1 Tax=Pteropus alecto TaxID=9402 RepID=UPI0007686F99|nr:pleckstrin homology domain-containing family F member 1 [Pteropus alecto]